MASNSDVAAEVGIVIKIEHSNLAEVVRLRDETRCIGNERGVLKFGWTDRNDTAQLTAHLRFRQQTVINSQWFVGEFVHPIHVLTLDEEIRRIEEPADTDRHVVIQKIGGLGDLQIDCCLVVFEFEFQLAFEEKTIGQLPEKKRVERGVEKWILAATRRKSRRPVTSEQKLRRSGIGLFHLRLQAFHLLT